MQTVSENKLQEIAVRIREMREIIGFSVAEMAEKTEVSIQEYEAYEAGRCDLPFTFIHNCSVAFNIEITEFLNGPSAHM